MGQLFLFERLPIPEIALLYSKNDIRHKRKRMEVVRICFYIAILLKNEVIEVISIK